MAEQGLAVASAEQEHEPLQVLAQLADVIGGVANEVLQGGAEAGGIAGQPFTEELQHLGQLGRIADLLTELADRSFERCVRRPAVLARFRLCDQRRGYAAGVVRAGGVAARFA